MNICIDCRLSGSAHAGIGRYITQLTKHMVQKSQHSWTLVCYSAEQAAELQAHLTDAPTAQITWNIAPYKHYSLKEQVMMPQVFNKIDADVVHIPHFNVPLLWSHPKLVLTIHDLLWHHQRGSMVTTLPWWLYWPKYFAYQYVTKHAVSAAQTILVPSKTIKKTVTDYYPQAESKITVTYEGATRFIHSSIHPEAQPSIIYIGSLYPHKNLQTVFQALKLLPNFSLTLVGARSAFLEQTLKQAEQAGVASQVKYLGYVSDENLEELLKNAACVIQPSLSEGFGLPGVEAQLSGVPLVAADTPIFREIYADAAEYFVPTDPQSCAQAITAISAPEKRAELSTKGPLWASQYSWGKVAQETLSVYENLR